MRPITIFLLLLFISCKSISEKEKREKDITGDWLVLYADHQLKSNRERELYIKMQDSIVGLTALKLVRFDKDGSFLQMDSLHTKGRWEVREDMQLEIAGAGKGFNPFRAVFVDYKKDVIQLAEYVKAKDENIKLVWHLKKLSSDEARLLSAERNEWRIKPLQRENDEVIKKRLIAMLYYYSDYYKLVTKYSSFFVPARVLMPLKFYQHGMGLNSISDNKGFANLFYNEADAATAYLYLEQAMYSLRNDFPSGKNFIEEYATFMKMMGDNLSKKVSKQKSVK